MKLTRNLLVILALASFTLAFAGQTEMGAKRHEAVTAETREMKDCGQCKGCTSRVTKTPPHKVRETGPRDQDYYFQDNFDSM